MLLFIAVACISSNIIRPVGKHDWDRGTYSVLASLLSHARHKMETRAERTDVNTLTVNVVG